jgi:hypothetical protein
MYKAKTGETKWKLHKDMRKYGGDVYNVWILDVVKGKALAHQIETEFLQQKKYELNSTH